MTTAEWNFLTAFIVIVALPLWYWKSIVSFLLVQFHVTVQLGIVVCVCNRNVVMQRTLAHGKQELLIYVSMLLEQIFILLLVRFINIIIILTAWYSINALLHIVVPINCYECTITMLALPRPLFFTFPVRIHVFQMQKWIWPSLSVREENNMVNIVYHGSQPHWAQSVYELRCDVQRWKNGIKMNVVISLTLKIIIP